MSSPPHLDDVADLTAIFLKKFDKINNRLDGMQTTITAIWDEFTPHLAILEDDDYNDDQDDDDDDDNKEYNDEDKYDNNNEYNDDGNDEYDDDNDEYDDNYEEYDDNNDNNDNNGDNDEDDIDAKDEYKDVVGRFFARVDATMAKIQAMDDGFENRAAAREKV